jgi:RNA polymerase sigma-70 factor (ECF subfamily)
MTDEEVIRRVQNGDRELFELIFERHYVRMDRYARHLGVPPGEVEDLVAETFARAFARADRFDSASGTRYLSYLYAIARNLATDRLRERQRNGPVALLEDPGAAEAALAGPEDPVAELLRREQVARIRDALARLGPGDREIIYLSYDREMSCREIMAVMGKPSITAVTTHLYKAMRKLRALVLAAEPIADSGARSASACGDHR